MERVRIGILGAARIAPMALIRPARKVPEAPVTAIAARDPARAKKFADKHGIEKVHASYQDLIADPDIDAIYNPLPNGLHCEWSERALDAGKHVLCEKPLTSNAREAEQLAAAAERSGRVLMEAFHWRYHPLAARMLGVVQSGELGKVRHIETALCFPLPIFSDIRYRLDLAGGALMDAGCYAVHMLRTLAGDEPQVVRAEAKLAKPGVDRCMTADFEFADGRSGRIHASLFSARLLQTSARVEGELGTLRVLNPLAPHIYHRLRVKTPTSQRSERVPGESTYLCQLRAFAKAVLNGAPILTPPSESIANMRVIDAIYRSAGLEPRGSSR